MTFNIGILSRSIRAVRTAIRFLPSVTSVVHHEMTLDMIDFPAERAWHPTTWTPI